MENDSKLEVIIFPWLAFGHLIPALELSKCLASRGHHVSFVSTPRNIQRLPSLPPSLLPLITFINLPFPRTENLPENAESSTDIQPSKAPLLMTAFDGLKPHFSNFLDNSTRPDWIIHDYAPYWLPELAAKHGIPCVFFGVFNAASLSFLGPPKVLLSEEGRFTSLDSFTIVPKWIPFRSDIVYRFYEILPYIERAAAAAASGVSAESDISEAHRFGVVIRDCEFVALRSCVELESEWIDFLAQLIEKPVVPVGSLHPSIQEVENNQVVDEEKWVDIREWLEKQEEGSVVYVAFGTEATLSQNQLTQLAIGLENSGLPFFWVLRAPRESFVDDVLTMLPDGFKDRVKDRGVVWTSWAPQVKILAHRSIGGVLTHCGWNSLIESLGFGRALVLLPLLSDQGLNARLLEGKKLGLEIPRDARDGSFTSESVAESLKTVMVDKEGEVFRNNAREMKVLADKSQMGRYVDGLIGVLKAHKREEVTLAEEHPI